MVFVTATLLHFTASWAEAICAPHRAEVRAAATTLGCEVLERDVDVHPEDAQAYGVMNVPAVAVEGQQGRPPLVGARSAEDLIALLSEFA